MANNLIKRKEKATQGPLDFMRTGLDDLFDNFFREFDFAPSSLARSSSFIPRMDITGNDKEYKISAELPGLSKENVDIELNEDMLTVKGEKKSEIKEEESGRYHVERSYGTFSRTVRLPNDIDVDSVSADFKDGVLNITLPKSKEAKEKSKKIQIK